jgi:aminopeptidase N
MLRSVMGDKAFIQLMKTFPDQHAWGSATTEEFRKLAEQACGEPG